MKVLLIITWPWLFNAPDSLAIRHDFHTLDLNQQTLNSMISSGEYVDTPLTQGYLGLCEMMLAQYTYWPISQLTYFNNGKAKIEQAIAADPMNAELRYLRLLVQLNAPLFLFYNGEIDNDLELFFLNWANAPDEVRWQLKFIGNLKKAKYLNDERLNEIMENEQAILKKLASHNVNLTKNLSRN